MIRSIDILDPAKMYIEWWPKVPALAKPRKFEFQPGLNILFGKNGSGKSTLLKCMAQITHCAQGGEPLVTEDSFDELKGRYRRDGSVAPLSRETLVLDHDGQGVRFFDPSVAVGLAPGGAAFDYDFGLEGIQNAMFKGSAGQTTMHRLDKMMRSLILGETPEVKWKLRRPTDQASPDYVEQIAVLDHFLKGSGDKGQPTILLDEPERSFDMTTQLTVWRMIRTYSDTVQFIVASHSFLALNLPEANYIEMDEEYMQKAEFVLARLLSSWPVEKPLSPIDPAKLRT